MENKCLIFDCKMILGFLNMCTSKHLITFLRNIYNNLSFNKTILILAQSLLTHVFDGVNNI